MDFISLGGSIMELWKELLSDDVGVLSIITIVIATVVVVGAVWIVVNKVKKAGPND
jgi:membrane protein DedA with SNARE-associated domain